MATSDTLQEYLQDDSIYCGDARAMLRLVRPESVSLSFWSPPYFVGKSYERDMTFEEWQDLIRETIELHFDVLKPGGFLAINIADILAFPDSDMPLRLCLLETRHYDDRQNSIGQG